MFMRLSTEKEEINMAEYGAGKQEKEKVEYWDLPSNDRHGSWHVEIPEGCTKLRHALGIVIPAALEEVESRVRRLNVRIHFLPRIIQKDGLGKEVGGTTGYSFYDLDKRSLDCVFSEESIMQMDKPMYRSVDISWFILHEFFEVDYWVKSGQIAEKPIHMSTSEPDYNFAEHEDIANRKALTCLQREIGLTYDFEKESKGWKLGIPVFYND